MKEAKSKVPHMGCRGLGNKENVEVQGFFLGWWSILELDDDLLKEISPGCSLEGLMLKLKLQLWPPRAKS